MNKNILLTGSSGFIGNSLKNYLINKGYNIISLNIRSCETDKIFLDKLNNEIIFNKINLDSKSIYALVHVGWGHTDNPWSNYHLQENVRNSKLLFDFAKKLHIKKVIFCGSMNEYGDITGPISEESVPGKIETDYAKAKSLVTSYGTELYKNTITNFFTVRPFYVYGNVFNKKSLINQLIDSYYNNTIMKMGSCKAFRDYVYVDDVVRLFYLILHNKEIETGIYNIGYGECITVKEFVENFWLQLGGNKKNLSFGAISDRKEQVQPRSFSSNLKINKNFNWQPEINLKNGLKLMTDEIKKDKFK